MTTLKTKPYELWVHGYSKVTYTPHCSKWGGGGGYGEWITQNCWCRDDGCDDVMMENMILGILKMCVKGCSQGENHVFAQ